MGVVVSGNLAVLQMEVVWALLFVVGWIWLQNRKRAQTDTRSADRKGAYVSMNPVESV